MSAGARDAPSARIDDSMPDRRQHRGPHPEDARGFSERALPRLRAAVAELSWLLGRGYATPSALALVGNRHQLTERQRLAVRRASCSDAERAARLARRVAPEALAGRDVVVDGFNLLTTVEAALGGAVLLRCRDETLRDMASVHGSWRRVTESRDAIALVAETLGTLDVGAVHWLLDRPVSNSGRLRALLLEAASERDLAWSVELVPDPDPLLAAEARAVVSADSNVLDRCGAWLDLASRVELPTTAFLVDLREPTSAV